MVTPTRKDAALRHRLNELGAWVKRETAMAVGLLLVAVLITGFLMVADEVMEGETAALDAAVLDLLRRAGEPHTPVGPEWLTIAAADLTALGSIAVLGVVVLIVGGLFLSIGKPRQATVLVAASAGAVAWSQGLKALFDRPRPEAVYHVVEVVNASFPSGHAMLSAGVYLTLGALVSRFSTRRRVRVFALTAAISLTFLVGVSRVFLGVHWPTDVLAGWSVGAAWALACWLAETAWERRTGARDM